MRTRILWLVGIPLALWFVSGFISQFVANVFWFAELGYAQVFWLRFWVKAGIWTIVTAASLAFVLSNLGLARRIGNRQDQRIAASEGADIPTAPYVQVPEENPRRPVLTLRWLLPLAWGLSLLIGLLGVHYGQEAFNLWNPDLKQLDISPSLPAQFRLETIGELANQTRDFATVQTEVVVKIALLLVIAIVPLIYPQTVLGVLGLGLSLGFGLILSAHWSDVLKYLHATNFNTIDPLFSRDVGFYVFFLPILELLEFWLIGLFLYVLVAVALIYLLGGESLSQGRFYGFSRSQLQHLYSLGGCFALALCLRDWIRRYELLYSTRGVVYGAGYTGVQIELPAYTVLTLLTAAIACFLFWQAFASNRRGKPPVVKMKRPQINQPLRGLQNQTLIPPRPTFLLCFLGGYLVLAAIATTLLPDMCQSLIVQPNELAREQPYLRRSIALTRQAFALDQITVEVFDPLANLTYSDIQKNALTVRNIRLWDTRPLLQTNRQLQQIRPYYSFPDADIDRYTLVRQDVRGSGQATGTARASTEKQQVLISARELDYNSVPTDAKTWVNEHLVYTHGYGFTLSPVNRAAAGGLPDYYVRDIGSGTDPGELTISEPRIRASIPIDRPRIYYGEITNTYIMTGTRVQELDYPSGNENAYNIYDGRGGVGIRSMGHRWLFARYLKDWQMLFTNDFTDQTKLLFRRNINERVRWLAPFLRYDQDPYLVIADVGGERGQNNQPGASPNYLYWLIDAYTTSDRYPYSDPGQSRLDLQQGKPFNYIRNSIKVVVDAYHGSVDFYVADPDDPVIQAWMAIFPGLFKPLDAMPAALRSHIRYPADLFSIQSDRLLTYHMTDPTVFYNREDQWQLPTEIYGNQPRLVEPYYLITKLPSATAEEFITVLPYTPNQRTNLTGWIAARSDGENYGTSLLYDFPKQRLIFGTEQIEARINQDPAISQQISLWNRTGSRALQGNLLVIPIEDSLLYVEPLYLEAEQNSLPTLVRVIVAYENRIVMAETLEQSLQAIFQPPTPATPLVRPVE